MPSPFPGMNPYIEAEDVWHTFHQHFPSAVIEQLVPQLGGRYAAKIDAEVYIHELSGDQRTFAGRPDALVARTGGPAPGAGSAAAVTVAPAYATAPLAIDEVRIPYVKITDKSGRDVVAVIELLSPSNKNLPEDRAAYAMKRNRVLRSAAHLVEIDLLRAGQRPRLDGLPACDYYAMVSRVEERPRLAVWPLKLRERLPVIPVPLRPPHPDAHLDLQAVLDRIYDLGGFASFIYENAITPPLHPDDDRWAQQFLPKRP